MSWTLDITRRYYDTHAKQYFEQTCSRDIIEYWQMLERYMRPEARLIDLGCGSGRDMKRFGAKGYRVVGIDYSRPLLMLSANYSRQPVVLGDLRALPFANATLDAAWAMASLLHLNRPDARIALAQIRACLKPAAPFFAALKRGSGEEIDSFGRYIVHYEIGDWSQMLERAGFQIVECDERFEQRQLPAGLLQEIPWIATVAIAA